METPLPRIWTPITVSISYDGMATITPQEPPPPFLPLSLSLPLSLFLSLSLSLSLSLWAERLECLPIVRETWVQS